MRSVLLLHGSLGHGLELDVLVSQREVFALDGKVERLGSIELFGVSVNFVSSSVVEKFRDELGILFELFPEHLLVWVGSEEGLGDWVLQGTGSDKLDLSLLHMLGQIES